MLGPCQAAAGLCSTLHPPPANLAQKLFRRHKKRILLKNAPDDDHRMCPHDVDHRVSSKFPQLVGADDRVVVAEPYVVDTRLELNYVIDMRPIFNRPVHTATNAAQRKSSFVVSAGQLLKCLQHSILIEAAIGKVDFGVGPKLELAALLRDRRIDASGSQALQVVLTLLRVQDVNGFVSRLQPVFNER
jgi:hypothetical protein